MLIKIDYRENNLLATMNLLFKEHSHEIQHENLPLGDIIIVDESTSVEKIIVERKTLYDLAASIKDGRYNEQSFRLNNISLPNHNIIYLIEGDFEKYNVAKGRVDKKTLYSAMVALQYFKGFSIYKSKHINETCEFIIHFANKLQRESKKHPYYMSEKQEVSKSLELITINTDTAANTNTDISSTDDVKELSNDTIIEQKNESSSKHYCEVMKKVKKDNITPDNIGEIMLSTIPGVSSKSAIAIMNVYKTVPNLKFRLEETPDCLSSIRIDGNNGQIRRLTKPSIESIKRFILQ